MAARRIRPPQPLAPHGLPGHLVGFVEALRAQGISVGPSETVDAGRVMSVLGLGDRRGAAGGHRMRGPAPPPITGIPTTRCSTCGSQPRSAPARSN